jgi:hypothetical protein
MVWFKKPSPVGVKKEHSKNVETLLSMVPHPIRALKELISPGGPSVATLVTLTTCMCLNVECLILVWFRAKWNQPVTAELTIIAGMLSALIGYVYHRYKSSEERTAAHKPKRSTDKNPLTRAEDKG